MHLSQPILNTAIWTISLLLQCALALAVFRRDVARRFPAFAVLIVFYPLRSALLFALSGRVDADAFHSLYSMLELAEVPLLAFVAMELLFRLVRTLGGWTLRRGFWPLLLLCAACGLTWVTLKALPARLVVDHVQLLMWYLMIALCGLMAFTCCRGDAMRIAVGFAAYSLIQLVTLDGRALAVASHDSGAYVAWSYLPAIGYLAVVVYWLLALKREAARSE